jgi:hypothetical protein
MREICDKVRYLEAAPEEALLIEPHTVNNAG